MTAGSSASDQYAFGIKNPSTAAYASVDQEFDDGTGDLAQISAQRDPSVNGLGSGTGLFINTKDTSGNLASRIAINSYGNIGIGTISPGAMLDVSGTVRPGSVTAANIGASCSPLGAQGYNATTGAPVYCSSSLVWAASGGFSSCTQVTATGTATCAAGYTMTGGGCTASGVGYLVNDMPSTGNSWYCGWSGGTGTAYAICCH